MLSKRNYLKRLIILYRQAHTFRKIRKKILIKLNVTKVTKPVNVSTKTLFVKFLQNGNGRNTFFVENVSFSFHLLHQNLLQKKLQKILFKIFTPSKLFNFVKQYSALQRKKALEFFCLKTSLTFFCVVGQYWPLLFL